MLQAYAGLYRRFVAKYFHAKLEYKIPFLLDIIANVVNSLSFVSVIFFLMTHFDALEMWRLYDVLLMFGLGLLSWGIAGMIFWSPVVQMEQLIITGHFDHFLLKPIHPLLHLLFRHFSHTFIGQVLVGAGIVVVALNQSIVAFDFLFFLNSLYLLFNSVLVQGGILIALSALNFFMMKPLSFSMLIVVDLQVMSRYPASIYQRGLQMIITFLFPYIFVSYYPVMILTKGVTYLPYLWLTYFSGPVALMLAVLFFNLGITRYNSSGS